MNFSSDEISTIEKDNRPYPVEEKAYQFLWGLKRKFIEEEVLSNVRYAMLKCFPTKCKKVFNNLYKSFSNESLKNIFSDEVLIEIDEQLHYISYGSSECDFYIVSHPCEREQELMAIEKLDQNIDEHMRNTEIIISVETGATARRTLSMFHKQNCEGYVRRYYGNIDFFSFNYNCDDENLVEGFKNFLKKRGAGFMIKDYNLMDHFKFLEIQEYSTEFNHFSTYDSSHKMDHIGVEGKNRFIYFIKKSYATNLKDLAQDINDSDVYLHMFFMLHKKILIGKISGLISVIVIPTESIELIDEISKRCSSCGNFVITEVMFKHFSDKKFCDELLRLTRKTREKLYKHDFNDIKYGFSNIFGFMASRKATLIPCLTEIDVQKQMENAKILFNPTQLQIVNSKDKRVLLVGDYGSGKTLVARSLAQNLSLDLETDCFVHYVNFGTSNDLTTDMHRFAESLHNKQNIICKKVDHFQGQSVLVSLMKSIISNHKRYVKIHLIFDEVPINDWSEPEVREFIEILKEPQFTNSHCLIICQPMQTKRSYTEDGVIKSENKSFKEQIEMLTKEFNFKEKKLDEIFRNTIKIQELAKFTKGILEKWSNRYFEETSKKQVEDFDPNEEKEKGYEFSDNQVLRKIEKEDVEESRNTKEVSSDSGLIQVESLSSETSSSQLQGMSSSSKETPIESQKGENQSGIKKVKYQSTDDFIEPSNDIHVESNFDLSLKSDERFKQGASDSSALLENFVLYISDGKALHNIPGDDPLLYFPFESKDNYDKLEKTCLVSLCLENISEREIFIEKDDITLIHFETETPVILLNALDMLKDKNKFKHLSIKSVVETQGCEYNNLIIYLSIAEYHMRHYLVEAITRCKCNLIFIVMKNNWNLAETNVVQDMIKKWEQHSYVKKVLYEDLNYESLDELSRNYGKHFDFHHKEIVRNTPRAANVLKRFVNPNKFDVNYSQKMENQEKMLEEITSRVTAWEEFANVLSLDELSINHIKNSLLLTAQRTLEVMKSFTHPNPPTKSWEFWRKYLKEFEDGALAIEQIEMKFPFLSSEIADRLDNQLHRIQTEWGFVVVTHSTMKELVNLHTADVFHGKYDEVMSMKIKIHRGGGLEKYIPISEFCGAESKHYVNKYFGNHDFFCFNYDSKSNESLIESFKLYLQGKGTGFLIKEYDIMRHFEFLNVQDYITDYHFLTFKSSHKIDFIGVEEVNKAIYFIKKSNATTLKDLMQDIKDSAAYVRMFTLLHKKKLVDKISCLLPLIVIPNESERLIKEINEICSSCADFVITEEKFGQIDELDMLLNNLVENSFINDETWERLSQHEFSNFKYAIADIFCFMASEDIDLIPCLSDNVSEQIDNAKILFSPKQVELSNLKDKRVILMGSYGSGKTMIARSKLKKMSFSLEQYAFIHYINFGSSSDLTKDMNKFVESLYNNKQVVCQSIYEGEDHFKLINKLKSVKSSYAENTKIHLIFDEVPINDWTEEQVVKFIEILNEPQFIDSHCLIICRSIEKKRSSTPDGINFHYPFQDQVSMLSEESNFQIKELDEIFTNKIAELAKYTKNILKDHVNKSYQGTLNNLSENEGLAIKPAFEKRNDAENMTLGKTKPQVDERIESKKLENEASCVNEVTSLESTYSYYSNGKAIHKIPGKDPILYFPFDKKDNYDDFEKIYLVSLCLQNIVHANIMKKKDLITILHFEEKTPIVLQNALNYLKDNNKLPFKNLSMKSVVEAQGCEYDNVIIYLSSADYHIRHYLVEAITRCKCKLIFIVIKDEWKLSETNIVGDMIQKWDENGFVSKILFDELNYEQKSLDRLRKDYAKQFDSHHKGSIQYTSDAAIGVKSYLKSIVTSEDEVIPSKRKKQEINVVEEIASRITAWEEFANVLSLDELNIKYIKNSVLSSAQKTLEVMKSFTHPNPPTESWKFWRNYLKEFEDGVLAIEQIEMEFPILSSEIADRLEDTEFEDCAVDNTDT